MKPGLPPGLASSDGGTAPAAEEEAGPQDREHGLNMKATVARKGKLNDATFGKFISLYEGDKYVDPLKARLQSEAEKRKRNVTDKPFKAAHTLPKNATPGDYYGTSGKIPYIPPFDEKAKKKGEITQHPKGIYTSPAKKGTFGMDKFTISQRAGHKGVATEYEYQHDPLSLLQEKQRLEREKDQKARVSEKPFKPAAPPKKGGYGVPNTTISKGKGVAGEWEYVMAPTSTEGEGKEKAEKQEYMAFKPTNAFASQRVEHIPYIHDPEAPKLQAESDRKLAESKRIASTGSWKPTQSNKTDMVRSIVRMNLR